MWVIKLGGSLLDSSELQFWLTLVAKYGDGRVIIVPGGGVFANTVREVDQKLNLTSSCSHQLAVLAMDQVGILLVDREPKLVFARSELEISERSWQHRGIVWMPSHMVTTEGDDIPHSWEVTSDSLAAWLAQKIGAVKLVLIKSKKPNIGANVTTLADEGFVDRAFPSFTNSKDFETWIVDKSDYSSFSNGFNEEALTRVGVKLHQSII